MLWVVKYCPYSTVLETINFTNWPCIVYGVMANGVMVDGVNGLCVWCNGLLYKVVMLNGSFTLYLMLLCLFFKKVVVISIHFIVGMLWLWIINILTLFDILTDLIFNCDKKYQIFKYSNRCLSQKQQDEGKSISGHQKIWNIITNTYKISSHIYPESN